MQQQTTGLSVSLKSASTGFLCALIPTPEVKAGHFPLKLPFILLEQALWASMRQSCSRAK